MYYSPSLGGFYCEEINGEFMPVDCVPISDELYESLMAGSQAGMAIVSDEKEIARCVTQEEARRLRETAQPTALQKSVEEIEALRQEAYRKEADPLFFKAQRGKATMEEWKAKIAEIKKRYPSPIPGADDETAEDAPPEDNAQVHEETSAQNGADATGAAGTVDAAGAADAQDSTGLPSDAAPQNEAAGTIEAPEQPAADQDESTAPQTEPVAEASPPAEPEAEAQATDEPVAEVEPTVEHEASSEEPPEPTPPTEAPATATDDTTADAPIAGQDAAAAPATEATPPGGAAGAEDTTDGQDSAPKPGEPTAQ